MTPDQLIVVLQALLTVLCSVLWYLFLSVKNKADKAAEDLLTYKAYIAEHYVPQSQLTKAIDTINNNIQSVLSTLSRVEERLYQKEQRVP